MNILKALNDIHCLRLFYCYVWHFYIGSIPIVATTKEISLKRLKTLKNVY